MATITTDTDRLLEVLYERFLEHVDGYWYPREAGDPLVRVVLRESTYTIERRRTLHLPWMELVTALRGSFDADSFASWADSFQLTD